MKNKAHRHNPEILFDDADTSTATAKSENTLRGSITLSTEQQHRYIGLVPLRVLCGNGLHASVETFQRLVANSGQALQTLGYRFDGILT